MPYLDGTWCQCVALTYADVLCKHHAGGIGKKSGTTLSGPTVREPEVKPDYGRVASAFALVVATLHFRWLTGTQGAVGHHHADDCAYLGVQLGAARVEQRGDVLVGSKFSAGPDLVALSLIALSSVRMMSALWP